MTTRWKPSRSLFVQSSFALLMSACGSSPQKDSAKSQDETTPTAPKAIEHPAQSDRADEPSKKASDSAEAKPTLTKTEEKPTISTSGEAPVKEAEPSKDSKKPAPAIEFKSSPQTPAKTPAAKTKKNKKDQEPTAAPTPSIDAKALYLKKCKSCHGASGDSNTKMGKKYEIPPLAGSKLSVSKAAKAIRNGVPDTKMKSFAKKLKPEEIEALAQYVTKL